MKATIVFKGLKKIEGILKLSSNLWYISEMTNALPRNWPKKFPYAAESCSPDVHLIFLRASLACQNNEDQIEPLLDAKCVHPDLLIQPITKKLSYKGAPFHPLSGKKTDRGYVERGVFASRKIKAGTLIGEYVGKISLIHFPNEPGQKFFTHSDSKYHWYAYANEHFFIIDAQEHANEMAFVNDYRGLNEVPNVKSQWVAHRGSYYFCYVATRDIEVGDEALVDYGESYWPREAT